MPPLPTIATIIREQDTLSLPGRTATYFGGWHTGGVDCPEVGGVIPPHIHTNEVQWRTPIPKTFVSTPTWNGGLSIPAPMVPNLTLFLVWKDGRFQLESKT